MSQSVAWILLIVSGLLDVALGNQREIRGRIHALELVVAFLRPTRRVHLSRRTLEVLPVGTAYAVWTGIGAVGTTILGILLFQESANIIRLGCIALVVVGIARLKLSG